ncbi:hypothetical protein HIM_07426 [Hirsutella minnesotensis 3608]|uniref:F-box domain-containing protein n=1 Tax=Hirsutella minnesotensis 3608 TaxID=1043627 RepID=A0A0F8A4A3_9HYPO|nr:hypothetical protein HIM_07426 [Hirsutella minnesotensis 3608]
MEKTTLGHLPDHLLLDIVDYLQTARDVSRLGLSSRRLYDLVHQEGWKTFVRNAFPSWGLPRGESTQWSSVADRLTYLDRCWERRALVFTTLQEDARKRGGGQRFTQRGQSVTFQCMLDALLLASGGEMFALGAGEDLLVRWRSTRGSKHPDVWKSLSGRDMEYTAGTGDVTAVSVIERESRCEIIVGRANGDVQLLDGTEGASFGRSTKRLVPADQHDAQGRRSSPGRLAVSWIDWQPETQMVASCRGSTLSLHALSSDAGEAALEPVVVYDVAKTARPGQKPLLRCAKFLGGDAIACGIGNSPEPLRWGHIRPTGVEFTSAAHADALDAISITPTKGATVRAIERVGEGRSNMLLSAWDDGSMRLMDLRTPSHTDAVYRDRFQPYARAGSLLVYGTERFVAGSTTEPVVRIFDFRYPKPYHHFDALPCSSQPPYPESPEVGRLRRSEKEGLAVALTDQDAAATFPSHCDSERRCVCRRHQEARHPSWRPDATFYLGQEASNNIFSLAKPSDSSGTFYCGLRGAMVEATCVLGQDVQPDGAKTPAPKGWMLAKDHKTSRPSVMLETGVSRCYDDDWQAVDRLNDLWLYHRMPPGNVRDANVPQQDWSRLDSTFRRAGYSDAR